MRDRESIPARPYYPGLDGVRAIAAMMVLVFHMKEDGLPLRGPISFGQTGVDLFFALSGFLISSILLKLRERNWEEVRKFYIRRSLRIFPLYYGYLIVAVLLGVHVAGWYWVYLQNIWIAMGGSLAGPGHFWSLAVEEQFYLVWPFLVLFMPRRWLLPMLWTILAASPFIRWGMLHTRVDVFYLTITRLDGLAGGSLLAVYQWRGELHNARGRLKVLALISFVLVGLQGWRYGGAGLPWVQATKYTLIAALYTSAIGLLLTSKPNWATGWLGSAPMRYVGRVSYGLYVFHQAAFLTCFSYLSRRSPVIKAAAGLALTFTITLLSWYLYESRFLKLKDRWGPASPRPREAPSPVAAEVATPP